MARLIFRVMVILRVLLFYIARRSNLGRYKVYLIYSYGIIRAFVNYLY